MTEDYICRTYGALIFYVNLFCRDSALRASSPAYKLPLLLLFLNSSVPQILKSSVPQILKSSIPYNNFLDDVAVGVFDIDKINT